MSRLSRQGKPDRESTPDASWLSIWDPLRIDGLGPAICHSGADAAPMDASCRIGARRAAPVLASTSQVRCFNPRSRGTSSMLASCPSGASSVRRSALHRLHLGRARGPCGALTGRVGSHERFLLAAQLRHLADLDELIEGLDAEITERLRSSEPVIEQLPPSRASIAGPPRYSSPRSDRR